MNTIKSSEFKKISAFVGILLVGALAINSYSSLTDDLTPKQRFELDYTGMGVADESALGDVLNGQDCLRNSVYDPNSNASNFDVSGDELIIDPFRAGNTLTLSGLSNINENLQPVDEESAIILRNAGCNLNFIKE